VQAEQALSLATRSVGKTPDSTGKFGRPKWDLTPIAIVRFATMRKCTISSIAKALIDLSERAIAAASPGANSAVPGFFRLNAEYGYVHIKECSISAASASK